MPKQTSKKQEKQTQTKKIHGNTSVDALDFHSLTDRTLVVLPISRVEEYSKNPRRRDNPRYNKIKDSIAKDGLNQPLVVTRRPGQENFVIYKGGNTRLKAIKELFDETGDHKYRFIECSYIPWSGYESDAVIGHLQENEMRKSLCFIDKSMGINTAIELLQLESESDEQLSMRNCHKQLNQKGYSIPISTLSTMHYAAEMIEPHVSSKTCETMGRRKVANLRKLQKALVSVCAEFNMSEEFAVEHFKQSLMNYPKIDWNFNLFRRPLEAGLANQVDASIQDITLRLDGYMNLSSVPLNESFEKIIPDLEQFEQHKLIESSYSKFVPDTGNLMDEAQNHDAIKLKTDFTPVFESVTLGKTPPPPKSDSDSTPKTTQRRKRDRKAQRSEIDQELEELRKRACLSATRIAKNQGFLVHPETKQSIVLDIGDWGIGYLIADYPPPVERVNPSAVASRDALWWLLMEYSDLQWAVECARPATAKFIGNTNLIHFIKSGDPKTLISHAKGRMRCNFPHLGLICFCLRQIDDDTWNQLRVLTDCYRKIHQLASDNNVHLFRAPSKRRKSYVH